MRDGHFVVGNAAAVWHWTSVLTRTMRSSLFAQPLLESSLQWLDLFVGQFTLSLTTVGK